MYYMYVLLVSVLLCAVCDFEKELSRAVYWVTLAWEGGKNNLLILSVEYAGVYDDPIIQCILYDNDRSPYILCIL